MTSVRIPRIYQVTVLLIMAAVAVMLGAMVRVLLPPQPVTIKEPVAIFGATTIRPGDPIELVIDYCADTEAFGWVSGIFASNGVITPAGIVWPASLTRGCHVVHLRFDTPRSLRPGSYRFYMLRHYQPTGVGDVDMEVRSETFTVVE